MIDRNLTPTLLKSAGWYPVVTLTGPRQSGKTTLCRTVFPDKPYINLERLDVREYAATDPRGFLAEYAGGAILDEVQHVPSLLSWIQADVDLNPEPGRFILTGSQHFGLLNTVSQSLAGRTAVLHLLPPGLDELRRFTTAPIGLFDTLLVGAYPRIHDRGIPPDRWLADYLTTYIQRDVRQVLHVADLEAFTTFLRLCAGRTGQVVNLSALGADAGVSHNTARSWLSVLETSFLCFRLPAWHRNVKKQMTRAPKLHFFDSGLVCHLLGIRDAGQLRHHPLRGAIFESWVTAEVYKARAHRGLAPRLHHFRDARGHEVDLVVERARHLTLVEMKSGSTVAGDFFGPLTRLATLVEPVAAGRTVESRLVYGGDESQHRTAGQVVPWTAIALKDWGD